MNLDAKDPVSINYKEKTGPEPTGLEHPELLKVKADTQHSGTIVNGISRIGFMSGGQQAHWKDEDFAKVLSGKAKEFIIKHKDEPFFLFFSLPNIHVPRAPDPRFSGASKLGSRGDAILEMDWMTAEIMRTLRDAGIEENTLVIFSSDNGPVLDDGYADKASELNGNHTPAGIYKGGKYSAFEGGTRVPTIAYWPGVIKPGKSNALLSQVDFFASLAQLTGQYHSSALIAPDSEDMSAVLLGKSNKGRNIMLEESFTMALREGDWKYIEPVSKKTPGWLSNKDIATGLQSTPQLYNLQADPKEENNLIDKFPQKAEQLKEKLRKIKINTGRNSG